MFELVIILLILSGAMISVLGITAFQQRPSTLVFSFAVSMLCAAIWNFGFTAEIISPSLEGKIFWANIQFVGIVFLPVAWLAMTMAATGQPRQALRKIPALGVIPALTILVIWTNPYHHIFRLNPSITTIGVPFPVLNNDYGPYFYAVHAPYGYFLFAASLCILIRSWRQAAAVYRRQCFVLVLSLLLPLLVDLLYVLGITPIPAFNFTSIVFTLSGLLLGVNILQLRFLDIRPLAYEAAINEMDVGVIVLDSPGRVSHLNPAAEKITGVFNDQAIGVDARQLFPGLAPIWDSAKKLTEIVIPRGDDEFTYQLQRSKILRGRKERVGQVITLHNMTEQAKLHKQVEKLSITDSLTSALNRRGLTLYGEQEIQRAHRYQQKLSLILLDVDNFKEINDRYGHQSGDYVLITIVQVIRNEIRTNDLIFRYGGDEFVVLLIETDAPEAIETADRIRGKLAHLSVGDEHTKPQKALVSMGITNLSSDDNLESLLQRADQTLYQAKAAGKDQAVLA